MGLERMASILQGVDNLYEIDEVRPILDRAAELTGKRYGVHSGQAANQSHPDDVRLRVVADHVRTALMLIGDGVTPSNEGRGYVLRRIMRRAIRAVRLLGWQERALPELLPVARDCMAPSYPELATDFDRIAAYAYAEEDAFLATLRAGTTILDTAIAETRTAGGRALSGDKAFQLHDTYGFPIDLTLEIAAEQGLDVDQEGFRRLMADQRARAKADAQARKTGHTDLSAYRSVLDAGGPVTFTGYTETTRESTVRAVLGAAGPRAAAVEGDVVELVLDTTPFYAEGGGQQPDHGMITVGGGQVEVLDVQQPVPGLIVHRARVIRGEVRAGETGYAEIDTSRRRAISRSHTATHLVHQTMRNFLGESATQAGSLNAPGRLRFDFNTATGVAPSVLRDVEQQVNEVLLADLEVHAFVTSLEEARRIGAMALFGEKYGEQVRVVEVGDYARELCGGTHVSRSGQLGLVKILSEASIGSGVRRVEALVGMDAFNFLAREHLLVVPPRRVVPGALRAGRRPGRADRHPAARRREGAGEAARPTGARRRRGAGGPGQGRAGGRVRRHRSARGGGRQRCADPRPGDPGPDRPRPARSGRGGGPLERQGVPGGGGEPGRPQPRAGRERSGEGRVLGARRRQPGSCPGRRAARVGGAEPPAHGREGDRRGVSHQRGGSGRANPVRPDPFFAKGDAA